MDPLKQQPQQESRLHFLDYWRIIRIRKTVIIAVFLLVVITSTLVTFILPEKFNFYSMPTMISAAYIPVNKLEELNVSLKKGESTVVSEKQHPVIWELCRTIQFQREEFSADYSDDYIITADDERLQIFETIANGGQFIALKL